MWERVRRSPPELAAVEIEDTQLKSFDVIYGGDLYHHDVVGEERAQQVDMHPDTHHWKTVVSIGTPDGTYEKADDSKSDFPIWSSRLELPAWNTTAEFTGNSELDEAGWLEIGDLPDYENKARVHGVARGHVPRRGAPAGKVILAAVATPVTVAFDIAASPLYLLFGIAAVIVGHH